MLAIALAVAALFNAACHRDEPVITLPAPVVEPDLPADLSIAMERTACYGECPVFTVSIDATGTVNWNGKKFVASIGPQSKHISTDAVRTLLAQFDAMRFFELDDVYSINATDLPMTIFTLRRSGQTKQVILEWAWTPDIGFGDDYALERDADNNWVTIPTGKAERVAKFVALEALAKSVGEAADIAKWIGTEPAKRDR